MTRARGPVFAWWMIPISLAVAVVIATIVRIAIGGTPHLDFASIKPPKGYVDSGLSMEKLSKSVGEVNGEGTPRVLWHSDQPDSGRVIFLYSGDEPDPADDAKRLAELEGVVTSSTRRYEKKRAETRSVGSYRFAIVEALRGDGIHYHYGATNIAREFWAVGAVGRDAEVTAQTEAFEATLQALASAPIRRQKLDYEDFVRAIALGLMYGSAPAIAFAFIVSVRRRRASDRAQLEAAAAKAAR